MPINLTREGMSSTPNYRISTSKKGYQKATISGQFISINLEWKKELQVDAFLQTQLKIYLARALNNVGTLVIERAKMQSSGAPAKIVGAGKWENIKKYYNTPPLQYPELVRIFTGQYIRSFTKQVEMHPNLLKVSVLIGNKMFYAKYVEARKANLTNAMLALWTPILTKVGLAVGKAFTDWERKTVPGISSAMSNPLN